MKPIFCLIALFAWLMPIPGQADWENTEWGMSVEEVRTVTPRLLEPSAMMAMGGISGKPWAAALKEIREHDEPDTSTSSTYYLFDEGGLAVVFQHDLYWGDRATSNCDGKLDGLIADYGAPRLEEVTPADSSRAMDYLFARASDGTLVKVRMTIYDDESLPPFEVCLIGFDGRTD